jgi:hypothetical protein
MAGLQKSKMAKRYKRCKRLSVALRWLKAVVLRDVRSGLLAKQGATAAFLAVAVSEVVSASVCAQRLTALKFFSPKEAKYLVSIYIPHYSTVKI